MVWLASDEEAESFPAGLAAAIVDGPPGVEVEVLHASYDVPGARLLDLVTVMDRLRTECPWDREQTHRSLATYLLEETYETLEAIDSGDPDHLREELGDLLLQVFFHARIAAEAGDEGFTIDDVAAGIVDKLVHRHPHVFAGLEVADADEVNRNWERSRTGRRAAPRCSTACRWRCPHWPWPTRCSAGPPGSASPRPGPAPSGTGCWRWSSRPAPPGSTPSRSCATPYAGWPTRSGPPSRRRPPPGRPWIHLPPDHPGWRASHPRAAPSRRWASPAIRERSWEQCRASSTCTRWSTTTRASGTADGAAGTATGGPPSARR